MPTSDLEAAIDREIPMAVLGPSTTMNRLEGDVKKMAYVGLVPGTHEIDSKTLQLEGGDVVFVPRAGAYGRVARVVHSYGTYFLLDDGDGHVRANDVVFQRRPLKDGDVLDHVSDPGLRWKVGERNESRFLLWNERKQWTHANGLPIDWYWDSTPTTDLINPRLGDVFIYECESGVEEVEVVGLFYTRAVSDGDHFRDANGKTWRAKQLRLARRRPLSGELLRDHGRPLVFDGMPPASPEQRASFVMMDLAGVPTVYAVPSSLTALPNAAPASPPPMEVTDADRTFAAYLAQNSIFGKSGHALARIGEPRFKADTDRKSISYVSMSESALALHLYETDPDVYAEAMLRGEVPACPLHGDCHPASPNGAPNPFFELAVEAGWDLEVEREKTVSQQRSKVTTHLVCNCPDRLSRFLDAVDVAWKSEVVSETENSKGRRYDAELRAKQICDLVATTARK